MKNNSRKTTFNNDVNCGLTNRTKQRATLISITESIIKFFDGANLFFIVAMLFVMSIIFFPVLYILPGILLYILLFLLFSISCKRNKPNAQRWILAAIAILYMTTATCYYFFRGYPFFLIIITSVMLAIRYAISKREGIKTYIWALTPIFATIIQTIALIYITQHYTNMYKMNGYYPSIMDYTWYYYATTGIMIFLTTSLITNLTVLVYNRWWLWLSLTVITLGMAAYSTHFFWYSEFFVRKVPTVIVFVYMGGIAITYLIKLLFTKLTKEIKPNF